MKIQDLKVILINTNSLSYNFKKLIQVKKIFPNKIYCIIIYKVQCQLLIHTINKKDRQRNSLEEIKNFDIYNLIE
jgi:hypothetical protein